ncbi:DUF2085 domain-containing protein [Halovenus rubra]|uniref:DUF2085 domain-containing protein n=2 Tax=Halovenus rubra TaxID=869890 RepID=A0ABD5X8C4_9EURY
MKFDLLLCHGKSERCLSYSGYQFPLCTRCTGILIGCVIALLIEIIVGLPPIIFLPLYILLGFPATIDGITQLMRNRESNNQTRLITGIVGALGFMLFFRTLRFLLRL